MKLRMKQQHLYHKCNRHTQAAHNILPEHEDRRVYLITEGDETGEYVVGFELLGARNA